MPRVLRSRTHQNGRAARTVPALLNRSRKRLERVHVDDFLKPGRNLNVQLEQHYLGPMNNICLNCGARHFHCEGSSDNGTLFTQCCDKGKFKLPEYCESVLIEQLLENRHNASANFKNNTRSYNAALAMVSTGIQSEEQTGSGPYFQRIHGGIYHSMGSLMPQNGYDPVYAQLHIYDTSGSCPLRMRNANNSKCFSSFQLTRGQGDLWQPCFSVVKKTHS